MIHRPSAIRRTSVSSLRRADFAAAKLALEATGFVYRHATGIDMFLDGPNARARDGVNVIFSGEKVRPEYVTAPPDTAESDRPGRFSVVKLEWLVRMKLTSFRRKDQVNLSDMLETGIIDATWTARFPPELAARLQELIDTPEG